MPQDKRKIWLRKGSPANLNSVGSWKRLLLSKVGFSAARETLHIGTQQMAPMWMDLFQSMLVQGKCRLKWKNDGPGIGRDAKGAYSNLLGRFFARTYLEIYQNVQVLVPLDLAKRELEKHGYDIDTNPSGKGFYAADWIGLDNSRLVIAEAKGSYDTNIGRWRGPKNAKEKVRPPEIVIGALEQAKRTKISRKSSGLGLPAKRWAVASRWGTKYNKREPTVVAWTLDNDEGSLESSDYAKINQVLKRSDVTCILDALGHETASIIEHPSSDFDRIPENLIIQVNRRRIDRGFSALISPIGAYPIRPDEWVPPIPYFLWPFDFHEGYSGLAVASLSSRYIKNIMINEQGGGYEEGEESDERFEKRNGLTIVWLRRDDEISVLRD